MKQSAYGQGNISRRGKNSWRITVEFPRDPDGKRSQIGRTVRGLLADAKAVRRDMIRERDAVVDVKPAACMTFGTFYPKWLTDTVSIADKHRTRVLYESFGRNYFLPDLADTPMSEISTDQLQELVPVWKLRGTTISPKKQPLAGSTLQRMRSILHCSFESAIKRAKLTGVTANPVGGLDLGDRGSARVDMIPVELLPQLLTVLEGTVYCLPVQIALHTGLRLNEVLGLRWEDLQLEDCVLTVNCGFVINDRGVFDFGDTKTRSSRRSVDFPKDLSNLLRSRRELAEKRLGNVSTMLTEQVCLRPDGVRLTPCQVSHRLSKLCALEGLTGITFHKLRHTHVAILIHRGVNLLIIRDRVGHKSIKVTGDTYGHLMPASDLVAGPGVSPIVMVLEDVARMLPIRANIV